MVSSSLTIRSSTSCLTVAAILVARPDPGLLTIECVSSYTFKKFCNTTSGNCYIVIFFEEISDGVGSEAFGTIM